MKPVARPASCRISFASALIAILSAAPALAQTPTLDSEEWAFLTLINNYRAQNGVGRLQVSAALENSSRWMSNDMATKNYFSHTDSLGRDPFTRMKAFNYTYTPAGENIAAGTFTSDAQTAFNQWLNACDPDGSGNCTYAHRQNMRYPGYVVIGIARAYNSASTYSWYWTTDFGGFLDQTVNPANNISGRVTLAGAGLAGIAIALSGSSTATTTTDSSGNFAFNGLAGGGNYTVTPSSSAYVFTPSTQSFSNLSGNQTVNFAATAASGPPMLSVAKSHAGNFTQGQAGATYTITVSNAPTGPTSGVVTVTELLPSGLALVSMSGSGWSCTGAACTRSDVLNPGASYPSITVTVNVASNAASQITNQVTVSGGGSASTSAADATNILPLPVALGFYPVTPCRVADTRSFGGKTGAFGPPFLPRGSSRDFPILSGSCGIPATALAYSLNVTVSPHGPLGFLSIWPAGSPFPVVSTNSFDGSVVANAAIVPAGANGAVSVYASDDTDVFIDINGYFAPPNPQALAFYPVTPCRVADTRSYGGKTGAFGPPTMGPFETRTFPVSTSSCGVPSSAQAYSLNLTAWASGSLQYLSTWPAGQAQPFVSTLNAYGGGLVANAPLCPRAQGDRSACLSQTAPT